MTYTVNIATETTATILLIKTSSHCLQSHVRVTCVNISGTSGNCKWRVTLPPTKADLQTAYTITATSQKHGSVKISDVLFGDVWVCSGQSNMGFSLKSVKRVQ